MIPSDEPVVKQEPMPSISYPTSAPSFASPDVPPPPPPPSDSAVSNKRSRSSPDDMVRCLHSCCSREIPKGRLKQHTQSISNHPHCTAACPSHQYLQSRAVFRREHFTLPDGKSQVRCGHQACCQCAFATTQSALPAHERNRSLHSSCTRGTHMCFSLLETLEDLIQKRSATNDEKSENEDENDDDDEEDDDDGDGDGEIGRAGSAPGISFQDDSEAESDEGEDEDDEQLSKRVKTEPNSYSSSGLPPPPPPAAPKDSADKVACAHVCGCTKLIHPSHKSYHETRPELHLTCTSLHPCHSMLGSAFKRTRIVQPNGAVHVQCAHQCGCTHACLSTNIKKHERSARVHAQCNPDLPCWRLLVNPADVSRSRGGGRPVSNSKKACGHTCILPNSREPCVKTLSRNAHHENNFKIHRLCNPSCPRWNKELYDSQMGNLGNWSMGGGRLEDGEMDESESDSDSESAGEGGDASRSGEEDEVTEDEDSSGHNGYEKQNGEAESPLPPPPPPPPPELPMDAEEALGSLDELTDLTQLKVLYQKERSRRKYLEMEVSTLKDRLAAETAKIQQLNSFLKEKFGVESK